VKALQNTTPKTVTFIIILVLELSVLARFACSPNSSTIIVIRPDGSVNPPTAPILRLGATYIFLSDLYAEITVQRDDVVIDGNGFNLKGKSALNSTGVLLANVRNVTVKSIHITNFFFAIKINGSKNCVITGNNITNSNFSVWIEYSAEITVAENVLKNVWCGIALVYSHQNHISENTFMETEQGITLSWSFQNLIVNNNLTDNVSNISLAWSNNNTIIGNLVKAKVKGSWHGIRLHSSSNNTLLKNSVEGTFYAIRLLYNTVNNLIIGNNISSNSYGIIAWYATNNTIYHNRFIGNIEQAKCYSFPNKWDNGYKEGGNYWGDYAGVDEKSGSNQDQPGSDGIGDTPYIIDDKNVDHYPFISSSLKPASNQIPTFFFILVISALTLFVTAVLLFLRKERLKPKDKIKA